MQTYFDTVLNASNGKPVPGVLVQVNISGAGAASIFQDQGGVTPAANPLTTDLNGFYQFYAAEGAYDLVYSLNGTTVKTIVGIKLFDPQAMAMGTAAAPALAFINDTNNGIFSPALDTIAIATLGVERMRVLPSGRILVGTTTDDGSTALQVNGAIKATSSISAPVPTTDLTGILQAAQFPALTGDITTTAGALATALIPVGTAGTYTKVTTDANGRVSSGTSAQLASADFVNQGTTTTVLHGNAAGNPSFGAVSLTTDVSGALPTTSLSGTLQAGQFPALTGDITTTAGALATTLKNTGTAGTYTSVTTDAQGRVTAGGSAAGRLLRSNYYTSSTTYTIASDISFVVVYVVGAGGGGGGTNATGAAGGGGQGGGWSKRKIPVATLGTAGQTCTVTVGTAGTAGANTGGTGGTGGTSSFISASSVTLATATGGSGGVGTASASVLTAGGSAAGAGSTGDINLNGQPGIGGYSTAANASAMSGNGGVAAGNYTSGGGVGRAGSAGAGNAGTGFGAGGSGAIGTSAAGGAGTGGLIVLEEYS
jgi:hypothetical protein